LSNLTLVAQPSGQSCGALVRGINLSTELSAQEIAQRRSLWLQHQVIGFPDQPLSIEHFKRLALAFGPHGDDPFLAAMPGHAHVAEIKREADETTALFAESWHSDWSFLPTPPAGTMLHGCVIPPIGGDTVFANQYAEYEALSDAMKRSIEGRTGIHSARKGYARDGLYGDRDKGRSMAIIANDSARKTQLHPLVREHPETGRKALFVNPGYTIGIDGMGDEGAALLVELFEHQARAEFVYRHRWQADMVLLWDNRCLIHAATGGYQGYRRELRRITIAEQTRPGRPRPSQNEPGLD
jgi:taurine dioxygenase